MRRILQVLLSVSIVCFCNLSNINAKEETIVLAGSDYQGSDPTQSARQVTEILTAMQRDGIKAIDGFLFAGDYTVKLDYSAKDSNEGMTSLKTTVQNMFPSLKEENIVLEQGNHDNSKAGEPIYHSESGLHTFDSYSVYVINEKDYPWESGNQAGSYYENIDAHTANCLKESLEKLSKENYEKPIFVLCHIPLHITTRTNLYGDGEYGKYIFDVLNEYGKKNLNLFFLYGHNHSKGCENYLGGAAVFLKKGDEIYIPVLGCKHGANMEKGVTYTTETLNFTYMNAGYVGYFKDRGYSDGCLTMTSFKFDEEKVEIARYSKEGIHELKAKGIHANAYPSIDDTLIYESSQIVYLEKSELHKAKDKISEACSSALQIIKEIGIK